MVYGGKPSTGCQNCRQRRIKCDEDRPHCRACVRTGRTCPGYRHPLDVALRGQTAFRRKTNSATNESSPISKTVVPSKRPSPSLEDIDATVVKASPASKASKPAHPLSPSYLSIPRSVYLHLEDTVIPLFFNSYLYLPKDPQIKDGCMELLPQFYSNTQFQSPFHLSLLAVSSFSVAAWTGQRSLLQLSEHSFLKALRRTREALQVNIDGNMNELLMTVLMLSLFEDFASRKDRQLPPRDHLRGAVALINSRRPGQLNSPDSKVLAHAVQNEVIRTSIGLAYPMVPTPNVWPLSPPMAPTAGEQLVMATSGLVNLRLEWEVLSSKPPRHTTEDEILELLSKAQELDAKLLWWAHSVPSNWKPVPASIIPVSVRAAGLFNGRCDCYSDAWVAATWNSYRDSRIVIQNIVLSCLRMLPHHNPNIDANNTLQSTTTSSALTIQSLATDICASVPFLLGSQMESVQMNPYKVEYPEAEGRKVTHAHQQTAPLLGGWFLLGYMENMCTSGLCLGDEQIGWVMKQMQRILQIYTFGMKVGW